MFLSDISIKRPIFASVMMLALVTLGAFSYKRLAIDMFPDVEIPVITIVTKYPGASPGTVEPIIQKLDFSAMPVVSLAVRSETLSPRDLPTLVDKKIRRRFENIA